MGRFGIILFILAARGWSLLHAQGSQVVSSGYQFPSPPAVSFGQLITLFVRGLQSSDATADTLPLPTEINGISVGVKNPPQNYPSLLSILSVHPSPFCNTLPDNCGLTAVTVQIPPEQACFPGGLPQQCGPSYTLTMSVMQNGAAKQDFVFSVFVRSPQPHILNPCDTIMAHYGECYPIITHANGHLVSGTEAARPGETIVIYAVGLGATTPSVKSGTPAPSPAPVTATPVPLSLAFSLPSGPGSPTTGPAPPLWVPIGTWVQPAFAGLVPGFVGLYQINLKLPDTVPLQISPCGRAAYGGNVRILLGSGLSRGDVTEIETADICVQP